MSSNREFLQTKRSNFVKFVKQVVAKHKNHAKFASFNKKIADLEIVSMDLFVTAIVDTMVPFKENPIGFVTKVLQENGVESSDLTPEELTKLGLYIECFISVVSS